MPNRDQCNGSIYIKLNDGTDKYSMVTLMSGHNLISVQDTIYIDRAQLTIQVSIYEMFTALTNYTQSEGFMFIAIHILLQNSQIQVYEDTEPLS